MFEDLVAIEGDGDILEDNGQLARLGLEAGGRGFLEGSRHGTASSSKNGQRPKIPIMKRVMMKSMTMMSTDANTTACVVERPTPCVPPRVDMPK